MFSKIILTIGILGFTLASCAQSKSSDMRTSNEETLTQTQAPTAHPVLDTATFGGGCYWCTESYFQQLKGVKEVISGYSGGDIPNPTYEQVCSGTTGYVEVTNIIYDPSEISFARLLEAFWATHDPTTIDKQGHDVGPQYQSIIFYHDKAQKEKAETYKKRLDQSGTFDTPIVTTIEPLTSFYAAEEDMQDFYRRHPNNPYCRIVIRPKLEKFKEAFKDDLKESK